MLGVRRARPVYDTLNLQVLNPFVRYVTPHSASAVAYLKDRLANTNLNYDGRLIVDKAVRSLVPSFVEFKLHSEH
jgi:hypothetical protein